MGAKKFIKNLVNLVNANHEFNNELNKKIAELKAQIKEEENKQH